MAELINEQAADRAVGQRLQPVAGPLSQFRCVRCGYGASCRVAPHRCPMCSGGAWEYEAREQDLDLNRPLRRDPLL